MMLNAIFFVPYTSRVGFAIEPLARAFVQAVGLLNGGNCSPAHLAFRAIEERDEAAQRFGTSNLIVFDPENASASDRDRVRDYLRAHDIRLAMLLDVQPASPIVRELRRAGVSCVLGYWGAEISARSSPIKQLLKALSVRLPSPYRMNGLIFESRAMADIAVHARGCPPSMIDIVNTGVDPSRFGTRGPSRYVHEVFGAPAESTVVVYAGHAHERKGMGVLMDAVVSLVQARGVEKLFFLICGNRKNESQEWLKRIAGTGAEPAVVFAGYRADIARIFAHADIGVIPSSGWDSFPMTALEMQAAGLPLIASNLGGIPETLVEGTTGLLVRAGDHEDLAAKIAYLVDHPSERARLGTNGRRHVAEHLTIERQVARLAEVFQRRLDQAIVRASAPRFRSFARMPKQA